MCKNNMRIWTRVDKTDPASTKRVTFSTTKPYTAIDAYSQILAATEVFGPVGSGWGWRINEAIIVGENTDSALVISLVLWYQDRYAAEYKGEFPVYGTAPLYRGPSDSKRIDEDAYKKALTDAITKGLSYLGFNADVFLGKFDDAKYVEARKAEVKEGRPAQGIDHKKRVIYESIVAITEPLGKTEEYVTAPLKADGHENLKTVSISELKELLNNVRNKCGALQSTNTADKGMTADELDNYVISVVGLPEVEGHRKNG